MVNSFKDVIDKLGGTSAFARAVGMKINTAKMARSRDRLAAEWFAPTVAAAQRMGLNDISAERLIELATLPRKPAVKRQEAA